MEIQNAQIEWHEEFGNDPVLEIEVDEIPAVEAMRFETNDERSLWFAELDGYVRYYAWTGPKNEGGFGGREYPITTVEGEEVVLRGPWSSRAGVVNRVFEPHCVDVHITTSPKVLQRGYMWMGGSVTLDIAREAAAECYPDVRLQQVEKWGRDTVYVPFDDDHPIVELSGNVEAISDETVGEAEPRTSTST